MPSTLKTQNLGLNKFLSSDKPKMDDFNFDNQKLDEILGNHLDNAQSHMSSEEKNLLNNLAVKVGTYTGTGVGKPNSISLGFKPSFGMVFTPDYIPFRNDLNDPFKAEICASFFSKYGSTVGIQVTDTGFIATSGGSPYPQQEGIMLNEQGVNYIYICFR